MGDEIAEGHLSLSTTSQAAHFHSLLKPISSFLFVKKKKKIPTTLLKLISEAELATECGLRAK